MIAIVFDDFSTILCIVVWFHNSIRFHGKSGPGPVLDSVESVLKQVFYTYVVLYMNHQIIIQLKKSTSFFYVAVSVVHEIVQTWQFIHLGLVVQIEAKLKMCASAVALVAAVAENSSSSSSWS